MMKLFIKSLLISSVVILASCSAYQKRFGGKSGDYKNANATEKVQYPAGVNAQQPSNRYSIPEVKSTKEVSEVVPPDYQNE